MGVRGILGTERSIVEEGRLTRLPLMKQSEQTSLSDLQKFELDSMILNKTERLRKHEHLKQATSTMY